MASKKIDSDSDGESAPTEEATHGPQECMPCRGSGKVVSNLGGEPNTVTCPWCQGAGTRTPGIDAQQGWLSEREASEGAEPQTEAA